MHEEKPSVPLQHYIESLMDERDKRYDQRFQAQQEATDHALGAARWAISTAIAVAVLALGLIGFILNH